MVDGQCRQVRVWLAVDVPTAYSGATAPDLHRLPHYNEGYYTH
jgi:hypothetical protein